MFARSGTEAITLRSPRSSVSSIVSVEAYATVAAVNWSSASMQPSIDDCATNGRTASWISTFAMGGMPAAASASSAHAVLSTRSAPPSITMRTFG